MKKTTSFKKVVLCHTNDFKAETNDRIKIWVEANGGTFTKELEPEVTHLVASRKAWKRYHPLVKQARRMRTVRIVKYDWLEDSLMRKPVKALPEDKYLYEQTKFRLIRKSNNRAHTASIDKDDSTKKINIPRDKRIDISGVEFDKAIREFQEDLGNAGFHPYYDETGFVYIVTLLRYDILRSRFEKYKLKVGHYPPVSSRNVVPGLHSKLHLFPTSEPFGIAPVIRFKLARNVKASSYIHIAEPWAQSLQLYESNDRPCTYACYIQYTRPGIQKQVRVLAPPGSTWDFAWDVFQKIFLQKAGKGWNERPQNGIDINLDGEAEVDWYQYQTPRAGEPEGLRMISKAGKVVLADDSTGTTPELKNSRHVSRESPERCEPIVDIEAIVELGDEHFP